MLQFISHWLGLDNGSGPWYLWWSGIGSDIAEFAILGSIVTLYRRHKCSACWRLSHHAVENTHYKTCHKHLTLETHSALKAKHNRKYPEQHKILKGLK